MAGLQALLVAAVAVVVTLGPVPAGAVTPPGIDDGALALVAGMSAHPAPPEETERRAACNQLLMNGPPPRDAPVSQRVLDLRAAWQFSRGAGQRVAVVDTGVNPHPRLPGMQPGGDFVAAGDGTEDCDGHGTLVAGLIAATPSDTDGFAGVAPDAQIITIRQHSLEYDARSRSGGQQPGAMSTSGYGDVNTLAAAIVRAVDLHATVVNVSQVACAPAGVPLPDGALGAAVKYAFDNDVLVVTAAGNVEQSGQCHAQNDGSGWAAVKTVASPGWFDHYLVAVGATDPTSGAPAPFSLHGPWVSVAAPGRGIVSLDSSPGATGLVDSERTDNGLASIDGTSFSCAYVSGVAALVRARYPQLHVPQIIERIEQTAAHPSASRDDAVGYGLVNPVAALTDQLPSRPAGAGADVPHAMIPPPPPAPADPLPRRVASIGSLVLLVLLALGYGVWLPWRRRASDDPTDPDAPADNDTAAAGRIGRR